MLTSILLTTLASLASPADAPRGDYVEARTASVYAGACHYGSEYMTAGRGAVLGWSFDAGSHAGEPLAGMDLVVAVNADKNLAEKDAKRRSVVYVSKKATPAQRDAAVAWLKKHHAKVLGQVVEVRTTTVDVVRKKDAFGLKAGTGIDLVGETMPDRECCAMPFNVWYDPFVPVTGRLVGLTDRFQLREDKLGRRWSHPGENSVFVGRFGAVKAPKTVATAAR